MFNSELKTKFVRKYTTSISMANVCETIFNQFEPYETAWNADLCTRTTDELQPVIDTIAGLRVRSKWSRIIMLKNYVKWCINVENVPGACDGMLQINSTGLDKVKKQTVASPLHLQIYLNKIFSPESDKTADNIYRCFCWLAYAGISEDDILLVKCSDVDLSNMVIHYNDSDFPVYREAIPAIKNCIELTQFIYNHPHYTKTVWKERASGDSLVRGLRSGMSKYSYRAEISSRAKEHEAQSGMSLSYFRIWISGVFFRAYERETVGEKPSFISIAEQQMVGKTYKLDSGRNTLVAKRRQLARDYMVDYERWKLAYKI